MDMDKGRWIVWFKDVGKDDIPQVGGKGANLGEMAKASIPVPPGFIVTSQSYFDFLKKDNAAENATLNFKQVPAMLKCRDCSTGFTPQDTSWICPNCQSTKMEVTGGRDCFVESIEVEE